MSTVPIVSRVKLKCHHFRLALFALPALVGAGCSGIRASHSISPASFFLPGFGQIEPAEPPSDIQNPNIKPDQIQASVPIIIAQAP